MALSILISNSDDHLRNHGFLHERGESWTLSPAFDLNPNPGPGPKDLVDTLLGVADYFRLDSSEALEVLGQVTRAVGRWRNVAKSHGSLQQDLDVMEPAFGHGEGERARALTHSRPARSN